MSWVFSIIIWLCFPLCTMIGLYCLIKNIKRLKKNGVSKGIVAKTIIAAFVFVFGILVMLGIYMLAKLFVLQYTPETWIKSSFSKEEMDIICKELKLTQTDNYQISSAKYKSGEELSVYLHIDDEMAATLQYAYGDVTFYSTNRLQEYVNKTDGVVGFFREVCGYPEEYLEKEMKKLGSLNVQEKAACKTYETMFGEEQMCITIYPYGEDEYGLCTRYLQMANHSSSDEQEKKRE